MDESEQISAVIGHIYDAALDSALWPSALEKIGDFVGGSAAALYSKDAVRKSGNVFYQYGVEPEFIKSYFETYVKLDPFTVSRFFFPIGEVISTRDVMSHREYFATRFYKEWAKPQGWIDFVSASIDKSRTSYAEFGLFRHERNGFTDDKACKRMALLIGHVGRATAIDSAIDLHKGQSAALADTLDGLAAATCLIDAKGRIIWANVVAHSMLADASPIQSVDGKLKTLNAQCDETLQNVLANSNDDRIGSSSIPLNGRGGERHIAHVLPLTSGARRKAGATYSAVAAIFVRKAELAIPHPLETLTMTYLLTPTELRVLMSVVEIGGVREIAPILGVSENTVKTHLQHIFEKTGTSRQADLVKLVAGYSSPI